MAEKYFSARCLDMYRMRRIRVRKPSARERYACDSDETIGGCGRHARACSRERGARLLRRVAESRLSRVVQPAFYQEPEFHHPSRFRRLLLRFARASHDSVNRISNPIPNRNRFHGRRNPPADMAYGSYRRHCAHDYAAAGHRGRRLESRLDLCARAAGIGGWQSAVSPASGRAPRNHL
jgi:hypothetical protein